MNYKVIIYLLLALIIGGAIGRYSLPAKIEEKIVIQEKIVEVKSVEKKNDKVIVKLETIHPDGTRTIETKIIDKTITDSTDTIVDNKKSESSKVTEYNNQDWLISASVKDPLNISYGLDVKRRILGPIYIGTSVFTDKTISASIGFSF